MGLALSSSHHYSSQPRVRAQSDRHSSSNALQLILVKVSKIQNPKVGEILIRTSLRAIIVLRILLRVDILPKAMWNITLHLKAAPLASSTASPSLTHASNPETPLCTPSRWGTHRCTVVLPLPDKHTGKSTRYVSFFSFFFHKPSNMKVVFTSVWWHHAEC